MNTDTHKAARDFITANRICHMATVEGDTPYCRVMSVGRIDQDFTVWFAVFASSRKVRHLAATSKLCLSFYSSKADCTINGDGMVVNDQAVKDELWNDHLATYFTGGRTDPEYAILKVTPTSVRFRDFEKTGHAPVELID